MSITLKSLGGGAVTISKQTNKQTNKQTIFHLLCFFPIFDGEGFEGKNGMRKGKTIEVRVMCVLTLSSSNNRKNWRDGAGKTFLVRSFHLEYIAAYITQASDVYRGACDTTNALPGDIAVVHLEAIIERVVRYLAPCVFTVYRVP